MSFWITGDPEKLRLQQRVDELEEEKRYREEQEYQEFQRRQEEREAERRRRQREAINAMCYADDWPDAFRKNGIRFAQEAAEEKAMNEDPDMNCPACDFFQTQAKVNDAAWKAYEEAEKAAQDELKKLQEEHEAKVAAVEKGIREQTIKALKAQFDEKDCGGLCENLDNDDPQTYVYW